MLYQSTNHASIPSAGINVRIWKILQNQKDMPENDMLAVALLSKDALKEGCLCALVELVKRTVGRCNTVRGCGLAGATERYKAATSQKAQERTPLM